MEPTLTFTASVFGDTPAPIFRQIPNWAVRNECLAVGGTTKWGKTTLLATAVWGTIAAWERSSPTFCFSGTATLAASALTTDTARHEYNQEL